MYEPQSILVRIRQTHPIAGYFYEKGYKTRSNGKFHSKFVGDILKNKTYLGKIVWNKYSYDKKQKTRQGYKSVKNDASKIIEADGRHKAIISREDFDLVQEKLKRNRKGSLHRSSPKDYPLTGILYCAKCDHKYRGGYNISNHATKEKKRWYRCTAKQEHNIKCDNPSIKAEDLEPQIFAILEALVEHPDIKNGRIKEITTQHSIENDSGLKKKKAELKANLNDNKDKQKINNDSYLDKLLSKDVFTDKMIDLRNEEQKIKKEMSKIDMQLIEKERSDAYLNILKRIFENFDKTKENLDPITKKELLQLVFKKILIKDKKIVKLDLYQPFERYLKTLKCNISQTIAKGTEKSYILRPTAAK